MATTSAQRHRWTNDVFVSFRGEDIRKSFMDHLFKDFEQKGIHVFRDDTDLTLGENISPNLDKVIQKSRVLIVIFSKNYASSSWCLRELVKILECNQMGEHKHEVRIIFYDVKPDVVRKQTGSFAEAFARHEISNRTEVAKWKEALFMAANLSGWDLQDMANGSESKFIDSISREILEVLCREPLHVGKNLVGVDAHVKEMNLVRFVGSDKVHMIGICGISGIGKTTLAKAIYNLMYIHFEECVFCEDVQGVAKQKGLTQVQMQLIGKIMRTRVVEIPSVSEGIMVIKRRMSTKPILLVLDDVDHRDQLEALAGSPNWFFPGSLIIFTGRDKQLLCSHKVDEIFHVPVLPYYKALELFSLYAFGKNHPSKDLMELSNQVVNCMQGHPLALRVLGGCLYDKPIIVWESEVGRLQKYRHMEIQQKLRPSFDGLDYNQKRIFLDIACSLIGENKDFAASVLDSANCFVYLDIEILINKSLITISRDDNSLEMHELIRSMARGIIREEFVSKKVVSCILWNLSEVHNVLRKNKAIEAVEVLDLFVTRSSQNIHLDGEAFEDMKNLRILKICDVELGNFWYPFPLKLKDSKVTYSGRLRSLSNKLRLLYWQGCPFEFPSDFYPKNIVAIDLSYSHLKTLWTTPKYFGRLKVMKLRHCRNLTTTPDFTGITNLEKLVLKGCVNLVEFHPSFGMLKRLVVLNMRDCKHFRKFPSIVEMDSLEVLNLSGCSKVDKLPEFFGRNQTLRKLCVDGTAITVLPSFLFSQRNRQILESERRVEKRALRIVNNLIGIESRIGELNSLLGTEETQEVRMVGIYGMGGIGKTTISQALFRRISYKFEGSSFVKDVRENSKRDICALQEKILKDVLGTHHESLIEDPVDGADMIRARFCRKKVLLVLDDVDDINQLEFLAATHEWFGAGSIIIITTRDEHLLSNTNAKYKPAILLDEQAVELFSMHAFKRNSPLKGYEELSNRVIRYTGGLPLALKVLGSFFYGRETGVWESTLDRLEKKPNIEIFETLKVSFDGLDAYDKDIFLDIACFFKGHNRELVSRILDNPGFCSEIGINVLIHKSLITISKGCIHMHDVLQQMGLKIVRESYPNSRLWQYEEIHDIITSNKKLHAVEAIVSKSDHKNSGFSADIFENMKNIRLLHICGDFTSCKPTTLPDELRWLRWYQYPFSSLPVANLHKLVGLKIAFGKIEHLWMGYKFMPSLLFIHLEQLSCKSFPDVSGAPNVEMLTLSNCTKLVEVHESLGTLRKLAYLNMSGCWNLKRIPSMVEMESLETLDLSDCIRLKKFPEVSSRMKRLLNIYLNGCSSLKIITSSICELMNLKSLHLYDCMQLQKLPTELGRMEKLQELRLGLRDHNMAFQRQPDSINFQTLTTLCCLRKLDLSLRPIENKDFFNNLDALSSLEELHLSGNSKLVHLPASISRLFHLKHLELNHCQQLQTIQGLPSRIQVLKACDCILLEKIEDLTEEYEWLHKIRLPGCETLLENQENETYLDKMLQRSFLKKCVALDHVLSIVVPGSNIPSWFEEQRHGNQIALKLPSNSHADILGFTVCGVVQRNRPRGYVQTFGPSEIHFRVGIDRKLICKPEADYYINTSASTEKESVWIVYIPFSFFQLQKYDDLEGEDWLPFVKGNFIISILEPTDGYEKLVRCGAHLIYGQEVEIRSSIPDYDNSYRVSRLDNSFVYVEKCMNIE